MWNAPVGTLTPVLWPYIASRDITFTPGYLAPQEGKKDMYCTCGNTPHTFGCMMEDDPSSHCVADDYPRDNGYPCSHGDPCLCCDREPDPTPEEIEAMYLEDGYVKHSDCHCWVLKDDAGKPCAVCINNAIDAAYAESRRVARREESERLKGKDPLDPFAAD